MSHALKLALHFGASYKPGVTKGLDIPAMKRATENFTMHELAFFDEVVYSVIKSKDTGSPMDMKKLQRKAIVIDSGGMEGSNEDLLFAHAQGLEMFAKQNIPTCPCLNKITGKHVCTVDGSKLELTYVRQLRKGKIHEGKILWVKVDQPCFRVSGLHVLAKDDDGRLVPIELYHFIPSDGTTADGQAMFPVQTRLGIKEPYYDLNNMEIVCIRVDNPCNVIVEPPMVMDEDKKTAEDFKVEGNKSYARKRFDQAAALYSKGLAKTADKSLQIVLYLNRAAARLAQRQYKDAVEDCDSALSLDSLSAKGKYRKGQALFGLRRYDDAQAVYAAMIREALDDGQAVDKAWEDQLAKTKAAIALSKHGVYDLMTFPFDIEKQQETDVAEYFGPIAVRMCRNRAKGRGLFVTKDVKAGELLFVERAVSLCFGHPKTVLLDNSFEESITNSASQRGLMQDLVMLVNKDARANSLVSFMSTGEEDKSTLPILDFDMLRPNGPDLPPAPQVSAYAISQIVKVNAFAMKPSAEPSAATKKSIMKVMKHRGSKMDLVGISRCVIPQPATPLMEALIAGNVKPQSFAALLSRTSKENLNKSDSIGLTALHLTVFRDNEFACRALLKAGADPNVKDKQGWSPLHFTVHGCFKMNLAKALVKHGAAIDAQTEIGLTPLHYATMTQTPAAVTWLLQQGANPHLEEHFEGMSAAQFVQEVRMPMLDDAFKAGGHEVTPAWDAFGSGLFVVAALMNHGFPNNTRRRIVGRMMFVAAEDDIKAGTELTNVYGGGNLEEDRWDFD